MISFNESFEEQIESSEIVTDIPDPIETSVKLAPETIVS